MMARSSSRRAFTSSISSTRWKNGDSVGLAKSWVVFDCTAKVQFRRDLMRLFIIGATGGIGAELLDQALARGHRVTALARSSNKIGRVHERLKILGGNPLDADQLRRFLPE